MLSLFPCCVILILSTQTDRQTDGQGEEEEEEEDPPHNLFVPPLKYISIFVSLLLIFFNEHFVSNVSGCGGVLKIVGQLSLQWTKHSIICFLKSQINSHCILRSPGKGQYPCKCYIAAARAGQPVICLSVRKQRASPIWNVIGSQIQSKQPKVK